MAGLADRRTSVRSSRVPVDREGNLRTDWGRSCRSRQKPSASTATRCIRPFHFAAQHVPGLSPRCAGPGLRSRPARLSQGTRAIEQTLALPSRSPR